MEFKKGLIYKYKDIADGYAYYIGKKGAWCYFELIIYKGGRANLACIDSEFPDYESIGNNTYWRITDQVEERFLDETYTYFKKSKTFKKNVAGSLVSDLSSKGHIVGKLYKYEDADKIYGYYCGIHKGSCCFELVGFTGISLDHIDWTPKATHSYWCCDGVEDDFSNKPYVKSGDNFILEKDLDNNTMETKFKIGDRVNIIRNNHGTGESGFSNANSCTQDSDIFEIIHIAEYGALKLKCIEVSFSGFVHQIEIHPLTVRLIKSTESKFKVGDVVRVDDKVLTSSEIGEKHQLKIGDALPYEILNSWVREEGTTRYSEGGDWHRDMGSKWTCDKSIENFKMKDGHSAMKVGSGSIWVKIDGFRKFADKYEPDIVLTFEKAIEKLRKLNYSMAAISEYINGPSLSMAHYKRLPGSSCDDKARILYESWNDVGKVELITKSNKKLMSSDINHIQSVHTGLKQFKQSRL